MRGLSSTDNIYTRPHLSSTISRYVPAFARPRFTIGYILSSLAIGYVSYCILFSRPFFHTPLPPATGPYEVGSLDIEIPVEDPRNINEARLRTGEIALRLETVLFTLYYPADARLKSQKQKRHYWIPEPLWLTSYGYAKFAGVNNFLTNNLFTGIMGMLVGSAKIPAVIDLHLVSEDTLAATPKYSSKDGTVASDYEKNYPPSDFTAGLPITIFSHGYASSRTQYSHYLSELASRGYVCAAIEHRDGSGPGTPINIPSSPVSDSTTTQPDYTRVNRLMFSAKELTPQISGDEFKKAQLAFREAEILETTRIVQHLSLKRDYGRHIAIMNAMNEGSVALPNFYGRLDTNTTILVGHSFGATGTLNALANNPSTFRAGIALDPGKSSGSFSENIEAPVLVIHSNSWSRSKSVFNGRPHFDVVRDLVEQIKGRVGKSWFMTSLGTAHPSVTDAPVLEPLLLKWTTSTSVNEREALRQYMHVSDDFGKWVRDGTERNLLGLKENSREYSKDNSGMVEEYRKYWQIHVGNE